MSSRTHIAITVQCNAFKLQNCKTSTEQQLLYRRSKHWPLLYFGKREIDRDCTTPKLDPVLILEEEGGQSVSSGLVSQNRQSEPLLPFGVTSPAMYRRWPVNKLSNCKHPPLVRWSGRPWSVPECPVDGEGWSGTCGFATVVVQYLISTITGPFASGKDNEREFGNGCWTLSYG